MIAQVVQLYFPRAIQQWTASVTASTFIIKLDTVTIGSIVSTVITLCFTFKPYLDSTIFVFSRKLAGFPVQMFTKVLNKIKMFDILYPKF